MKISKELKVGLITVAAIVLLVTGVNFLKGHSFFGGEDKYTAYFPNSGTLTGASSVYIDGVAVGKVLSVEYMPQEDSMSKVKIEFSISEDDIRIPKTSKLEIGSVDLLTKGLLLKVGSDLSKGFYPPGARIQGGVETDIMTQVKDYADPALDKLQKLIQTVDRTVSSISAFWDTTATSEIEQSLVEVKTAIKTFGRVANDLEGLMTEEKVKLDRIFSNVESITDNLRKSNEEIKGILGNARKITDDLVTVNYKGVVEDAQKTLQKFNAALDDANAGKGTLGKLLHDDKLYNELVETNKALQDMANDIQLHPERYIHFSVLGAKTKGIPLSPRDEKKLRKVLDSIPD